MALKVVGVNLNQTWNKVVALQIDGLCHRAWALINVLNQAMQTCKTALYHFILKHKLCVGENYWGGSGRVH